MLHGAAPASRARNHQPPPHQRPAGPQVPALNIFKTSFEKGKFDANRKLSDGSLMQFTHIYPMDAVFDTMADVPEEVRTTAAPPPPPRPPLDRAAQHACVFRTVLAVAWGCDMGGGLGCSRTMAAGGCGQSALLHPGRCPHVNALHASVVEWPTAPGAWPARMHATGMWGRNQKHNQPSRTRHSGVPHVSFAAPQTGGGVRTSVCRRARRAVVQARGAQTKATHTLLSCMPNGQWRQRHDHYPPRWRGVGYRCSRASVNRTPTHVPGAAAAAGRHQQALRGQRQVDGVGGGGAGGGGQREV